MRTLRFLLRKEYLQIFRDRIMVAQLLLLPAIQLALLANAATFEVKSARLVVVDEDRSTTSRGLVDRMRGAGRFELEARPGVEQEHERLRPDRAGAQQVSCASAALSAALGRCSGRRTIAFPV